jgi:CRISPR-associated endonuclease/helicase Cas3
VRYRDFFKALTGFHPYAYQEQVEERLFAGDSVILRVPTGAGKTWAAVAPFVRSLGTTQRLADRLLYALPLRSLASSLHTTVYEHLAGVLGQVSAAGDSRQYPGGPHYCSLQIGGQKDDAFFRSDLIFTTIDQLLSSYVFLPVSLPDRVGNINAGALIGSLVVLDEIHLLDSSIALGTVIEMLDRLRGMCQFVLMTATTSDKAISWLAERLGAASVVVSDAEIRALPSQRTKHRTWRWSEERISAVAIASEHNGGRTIILFNSVQRAQDIFLDLERLYEDQSDQPRLLLLHSRFYPDDRKAVEEQLSRYFGPAATETNVILVTTQVIEAGMDISADQLHSELAPMNALVQRAGRTARYEHRPTAKVTIHEVAGLGPYKDKKDIVDATRSALKSLPAEGRVVDFVDERAWVETVHADVEKSELRQYNNLRTRRDAVHKAMDLGDRGRLSELVRDIDSVGVLIAKNPEDLFERRAWPRLLSVSGFSLLSLSRHFQNLAPGQWVAKGAIERENDERPGIMLEWPVLSAQQLRGQWLVAIHPDFASYHSRIGLRLGEGGPPPPVVFNETPPAQSYDYRFESWADHCRRITVQTRAMASSHARGVERLATHYRVPKEWIEDLVEISCATHDTGKLTVEWQATAWLWQEQKDARSREAGFTVPVRPQVPIAHTWFQSEVDRHLKRQYRFPPHATQGAFALCDALATRLTTSGGELWGRLAARSAVTAIARHHGARTRECTIFHLPPGSAHIVAQAIPAGWTGMELVECTDPLSRDQFPEVLLTFGLDADASAWPLYAFLVRRLRLADQAATGGNHNELSS